MTNPTIKPTVGRIVWFHPDPRTGESGFARHDDDQPFAAIIARVWSDTLVNLSVFDANGAAHSRTSVPLVQEGDPVPGSGSYCEWMPYQKGQAAKTEAVEKAETPAPSEYRQPSQREQLEYALVSGAAAHLSANANEAEHIAEGIKKALDKLCPKPVAALPVRDPGPDSLEREIAAKSTAPRVTPADIEAEITHCYYLNAGEAHRMYWPDPSAADETHPALDLLTFCVLVLRNGFTVTGESACASRANFDPEMGRRIARENAVNKVWAHLGFRLRDKLAGIAA